MFNNNTNLFELDKYFKNIEKQIYIKHENKFIIARLDGVKFRRVWNVVNYEERLLVMKAMVQATTKVMQDLVDGFVGYVQTDESSIIFNKERSLNLKVQKLASTIASRFTLEFNKYLLSIIEDKQTDFYKLVSNGLYFDCRLIAVNYNDLHKYIVYRQLFCIVNSYNKVLRDKSKIEINPLYFHYNDMENLKYYSEWDKYPTYIKYGNLIVKENKSYKVYNRIRFLGKSNLLEECLECSKLK